ncbi:leucine-rich repeat, immunoglobulin-like domain-containing kekkon 1 protein [Oratosquilla oratoria]|uniref:leucine-rich repeat, immunoglobulin-like domain-containing kekkon 1 protein n=1 Tax=Oratosquilla oratoria TaxID=337810 RepID=UPI003F75FDDA
MRSSRNTTTLSLAVLLALGLGSASACPTVCTCKWKSGKQTVECVSQGLISIPSIMDSGTQVLDISRNELKTLPRQVFVRANIINLQRLYLSECMLTLIDPEAFSELSNLVELDLSDNLLKAVPSESFRSTWSLRTLILRGNPIHRLGDDAFAHTPSLVTLDLSFSRISIVATRAFQPLTLLEKLKLQGNDLRQLPKEAVNSLTQLHGVELQDNPWSCDCEARPLWQRLRDVSHPVDPICSSPPRLRGKAFADITEEDLACPPRILPVSRRVEGVAGENATVTCPVGGLPAPHVQWYMGAEPVVNGSVVGTGRVYVVNEGTGGNSVSRLVISGAQEDHSGLFRCVAENSAGRAAANFTLAVTMRAATQASLDSSHLAGIIVALVLLALLVLGIIFLLVARVRSTTSTPTPAKPPVAAANGAPKTGTAAADSSSVEPPQKPPRLTDLTYPAASVGGHNGSVIGTRNNPDLVSEAERSQRNGSIPNGSGGTHGGGSVGAGGEYTRVEGDSLYPSGIWDNDTQDAEAMAMHEHYNPGYVGLENTVGDQSTTYDSSYGPVYGPLHSTPYRGPASSSAGPSEGRYDPQDYGYPADYGLPIPEVEGPPPSSTASDVYASKQDLYSSRRDMSPIGGGGPATQRPPMLMGSRQDVTEGAEEERVVTETPAGPPGERPWVPGSLGPTKSSSTVLAVPHGVPVLPPLPTTLNGRRIKSRESPDEGYQEGTEV